MRNRVFRRLVKLSEAALVKTGAERALIISTILKILDECTDAEYERATEIGGGILEKMIAAGIDFSDDTEPLHSAAVGTPTA